MSVVIPTFNRKDLLSEAVRSCLNQSWKNLEVVVVDDGSTDGTRKFVQRMLGSAWAGADVSYHSQANAGASAARNCGVRLARGQYVQFLDSDDVLSPSKIAKQVAILESPEYRDAPCCYCYGSVHSESQDSAPARRIGANAADAAALIRELCSRNVHVMSTPAPLWRREHLISHPGWREDIGLGDDLEYYVRLLANARVVGFVDEELFIVREHGGARLSATGASSSAVASLLKARRSVQESVVGAGLWDEHTQVAFLGAMRTIYANALETRNAELVAELERWLWDLSSVPRLRLGFKAMIGVRRAVGGRFLLSVHRCAKRLRTA